MTVKEVANKLGLTTIRVYQFIYSGRIKAKKIAGTSVWKIDEKSFEAFASIERPRGPMKKKSEVVD